MSSVWIRLAGVGGAVKDGVELVKRAIDGGL